MQKIYFSLFLFTVFLINSLSAQNVGIGIPNPNYKAHIFGDVDAGKAELLKLQNNNTSTGTAAQLKFTLSTDASLHSAAIEALRTNVPSSHATALLFSTCPGGCGTESNMAERMRIDPGGNIGIGVFGPSTKLDINGDLRVRSLSTGYLKSDNDGYISITTSIPWGDISGTPTIKGNKWDGTDNTSGDIGRTGNVGVGTTSPSDKLHVEGNMQLNGTGTIGLTDLSNGWLKIGSSLAFDDNEMHFGVDGHIGTIGAFDLIFRSNGNERMRLLSNGNFGISNNNPDRDVVIGSASNNTARYFKLISDNDVGIELIADNNNSGEDNNSYLFISQDGNLVNGVLGFSGADGVDPRDNAYSDALNNALLFGTGTNHPMQFGTNQSAHMSILSNGLVGIGTNAPTGKLHIIGGELRHNSPNDGAYNAFINVRAYNDDVDLLRVSANGHSTNSDYGFGIRYMGTRGGNNNSLSIFSDQQTGTQKEAVTILQDGKVGIGKSVPSTQLHVNSANFDDHILIERSGAPNGHISVSTGDWMAIWPGSGSDYTSKGIVLHNNGNVSIGTTNDQGYKLYVNGRLKTNGINETSDACLKKNVKSLDKSLEKVLALRGVNYEWRTDEFSEMEFTEGIELGLIAQEVEKILPELVDTDNEGYKSVQYSHVVPLLIEAIKEQQLIINEKDQKIETIEALNMEQEERIKKLENAVFSNTRESNKISVHR